MTDSVSALPIHTLIVPGACDVDDVCRHHELIDWVRRRAAECRRLLGYVGTFLLAQAGLLNGRRAVTYWMHCGLLASRYPNITVELSPGFREGGRNSPQLVLSIELD